MRTVAKAKRNKTCTDSQNKQKTKSSSTQGENIKMLAKRQKYQQNRSQKLKVAECAKGISKMFLEELKRFISRKCL